MLNAIILMCLLGVPDYGKMTGIATHLGGKTSLIGGSGIHYSPRLPMAAHRRFPYGSVVRVYNNDPQSLYYSDHVDVIIIDNGPRGPGRIIDLERDILWGLAGKRCGGLRVKLELVSTKNACNGQEFYCLRKKFGVSKFTSEITDRILGDL